MANKTDNTSQDAIDEEEIAGTAVPGQTSIDTDAVPQSRTACTVHSVLRSTLQLQGREMANITIVSELMSPKSKPKPSTTNSKTLGPSLAFPGRDGLGAYLADPASFPPSRVIYHTEKWVVINDLYPKSSVHILLLPRDKSKNLLHPFEALEDRQFLVDVQAEIKKLRVLVAKELRRRYSKFSAQEKERDDPLSADLVSEELPTGRDWGKDVISGVHAHPSMNHLHVHVLSRDRVSDCLKKKIHYNSFNTPFLIDVQDFPLDKDDVRRHPGKQGYLDSDLKCWRCGKTFGNKFARLKEHLAEEFEQWKRE